MYILIEGILFNLMQAFVWALEDWYNPPLKLRYPNFYWNKMKNICVATLIATPHVTCQIGPIIVGIICTMKTNTEELNEQ